MICQQLPDFVVVDEDDFADVIMHRGHGVGDLIEYEVDFALHLMTVRNATHEILYDLPVQRPRRDDDQS